MVLRLMWFIRWEMIPWITSSLASHLGRSRMAIYVLIYRIAVIRYIQHRRELEEFLERMQTSKRG
jgi:phenylpyruvate tautomerase PptA (4-oxalocrotonate tautomerase family)